MTVPRGGPENLSAPALSAVVDELASRAPIGVALYDYQTGAGWSYEGRREFHAASTIKIAVLACVYATLDMRGIEPWRRLHVRNRFFSAHDGTPYRIQAARDADAEVYRSIGKTMRIRELAHHMITVSSNLATNVLLDYVGVEAGRAILAARGVTGVDLVRGVEDDRAFDAGLSNRTTADGLVALLRGIFEGRFCGPDGTREMVDILAAQTFNRGIPAGLPPEVRPAARVAHKTGEISTVTHDAGLVFLPGRPPYVLAVLTETPPDTSERFAPIAQVSARAFDHVAHAGRDRWGTS